MPRPNTPVSLADLAAAGVRLRPYESVTIVRELVLQVVRGEVAGVPSLHVIRLSASGLVSVEGPVAAGGRPVMRAAQLLESLLPASEASNQFRVPGGLKLVLARALGTLDLPPFPSLDAFADALARFAATDPGAMVSNLVIAWSDFVASRSSGTVAQPTEPASAGSAALVERFMPPPVLEGRGASSTSTLTVSDIRRTRRATGMPLAQVADRSRIPVGLLRQLEWGYLFNWPGGFYGRTQLIRYARAAGLDEQLVVGTIEPLIQEAESRRALVVQEAESRRTLVVQSAPQPVATPAPEVRPEPVVEIQDIPLVITPSALTWSRPDDIALETPRTRTKVLAALAIPALLAIGLLPAWWAYSKPPIPPIAETASQTSTAVQPFTSPDGIASNPATAPNEPQPAAGQPAEAAAVPGRTIARPAGDSTAIDDTERADPGAASPSYQLAADPGPTAHPFASVGSAMFYPAESAGDERPALLRSDGGAVLRITKIVDDRASNFHVRLSPDRQRIAFDSDRGGDRGVYVADADGRNVRRVSPEGFAAIPSWSPDGSTLAFVRAEPDRPDVWNLWTLDLGTGELSKVTDHRSGQPWGGSWFPDGQRIAFTVEDRLVLRNLQDGSEEVYQSPRTGRVLRTAAVSPDGRHVIFQVDRDGGWLLEVADGAMRRVLDDPGAGEFTWAPDGRRVAYYTSQSEGWNVWVMAAR
ncbi:MAG: helix-turn-helix domain-containing protein [Vicinamibacterales bacterium]